MKALEMTYKYVEVKGGDHIRPAFQKLPDIFDFFNKHTKTPPAKEKKKDARIPHPSQYHVVALAN